MNANSTSGPRKPVTFAVDAAQQDSNGSQRRPAAFDEQFELVPDEIDPFPASNQKGHCHLHSQHQPDVVGFRS